MYVFACALEAAAPTVFVGLATGPVLVVTFPLRYLPFSPHFQCFPKFITCLLFKQFIIFMYYNFWLYSGHFDTITPFPLLLCLHNSTQLNSTQLNSTQLNSTQHCNLPTLTIKPFPAISYGCGTACNEEVKDRHTRASRAILICSQNCMTL
jgi:hypothetical protein